MFVVESFGFEVFADVTECFSLVGPVEGALKGVGGFEEFLCEGGEGVDGSLVCDFAVVVDGCGDVGVVCEGDFGSDRDAAAEEGEGGFSFFCFVFYFFCEFLVFDFVSFGGEAPEFVCCAADAGDLFQEGVGVFGADGVEFFGSGFSVEGVNGTQFGVQLVDEAVEFFVL